MGLGLRVRVRVKGLGLGLPYNNNTVAIKIECEMYTENYPYKNVAGVDVVRAWNLSIHVVENHS